jgi:hypothetical protein
MVCMSSLSILLGDRYSVHVTKLGRYTEQWKIALDQYYSIVRSAIMIAHRYEHGSSKWTTGTDTDAVKLCTNPHRPACWKYRRAQVGHRICPRLVDRTKQGISPPDHQPLRCCAPITDPGEVL